MSVKIVEMYKDVEHPSRTEKRVSALSEENITRFVEMSRKHYKDPEAYRTPDASDDPNCFDVLAVKTKLYPRIMGQVNDLSKSLGGEKDKLLEKLLRAAKIFKVDDTKLKEADTATRLCYEWTELIWQKCRRSVLNPGIAGFLELNGAHDFSQAFWDVILTAPLSQSLLPAIGMTYDFVGNLMEIDVDDTFGFLVPGVGGDLSKNDAGFVYINERRNFIANELMSLIRSSTKPVEVFTGGGGMLIELFNDGVIDALKSDKYLLPKIHVYDQDPALDDNEYIYEQIPHFKEIVVRHQCDIQTALQTCVAEGKQFDLCYTMGLLCYIPQLSAKVMGGVMAITKPGGKYVFDYLFEHLVWHRDAELLNYSGSSEGFHFFPREESIAKIQADVSAIAPMFAGKDFSFENNVSITDDSQHMGGFITVTKPD
ncbi:MAG: hypothetical protein Q4E47_00910 [Candidatus Saccharibacteria bacterium]|nr:hypothetical protein [Candidatus Saccharibacteria bacterium]